jgi:hypothetical protein
MDFKLGQIDQISKDFEKIKLVKNTEFSKVVLRNMKVLYGVRQRVLALRQLPTSPEFVAYDTAVQLLYDKHVLKDEAGNVHMDNNEPKVKDPEALEQDLAKLDIEHSVAKKELDEYQERVRLGLSTETFTIEDFHAITLPEDLDAVILEVILRYVPQT